MAFTQEQVQSLFDALSPALTQKIANDWEQGISCERIQTLEGQVRLLLKQGSSDGQSSVKLNHHRSALSLEKYTAEPKTKSLSEWRDEVFSCLSGIRVGIATILGWAASPQNCRVLTQRP